MRKAYFLLFLVLFGVTISSTVSAQTPAELQQAQKFLEDGNAAMSQGDFKSAIEIYTKASKLAPNAAIIYLNRGAAYSNNNDNDSAIKDFDKALQLGMDLSISDVAMAFYNRGTAYQAKGLYDRSIEDLTKAIELNPASDSYISRGNSLLVQKKYDLARADYERSIEISPQPNGFYNLARLNIELGKLDEAIIGLSKAIELNPRFSEAFSNRGTVYQKKRNLDLAVKDFSTAISLKPAGIYYANRASVYIQQGKFTEAVADLTKTIETYPRWRAAYLNRALAHRKLGQQARSNADLLKAKEVEKENFEPFKGANIMYLKDLADLEKQNQ